MLVITMKMLRKSHIFTVIDLETSISLNAKVSILKLLTRLGWFTGFEMFSSENPQSKGLIQDIIQGNFKSIAK